MGKIVLFCGFIILPPIQFLVDCKLHYTTNKWPWSSTDSTVSAL